MSPIHVVVFALGVAAALRVVLSAIRTMVVPRGDNDRLSRLAFRTIRRVFDAAARPSRPYEARDRIMAYYGPIALILLPAWWLILLALSFSAMFWAIGLPATEAVVVSGSSLLTLGFDRPAVPGGDLLSFAEAAIGLALVALLISYLPTIYGSFSRRELLVNLLEVRADSPPSPVVMITRIDRLSGLDVLHDLWERWEQWFAELEETHTSLPVLVFYRSQQNDHSWVNASGAMMDAAAIVRSAVAIPQDAQADLMIRAGYIALRRIAALFGIEFDPHPSPDAATSVDRARFDEALAVLERSGVPLLADRDQAWRDFNGWRVNYDSVLRALERLTMAPTPWWERPIRSAWATDEPEVATGASPAGTAASMDTATLVEDAGESS
ncbi:MAG TPA: hypothetical protein VGO64_11055 [Candidatus Limnocylindrales bacterium]|nr:hypothetical protein [Candidatus Limnocylindrales bacterium]